MSIDAIAVLQIDYPTLCAAHGLTPASSAADAWEQTLPFVPLGADGTACSFGHRFRLEIEYLEALVRTAVGPSLDRHADPRGILLVPDVAWPDAGFGSYAETIEYFGEAGQWVKKIDAATAQQRIAAQIGGSLGVDLSALQGQLGSIAAGLDPNAMQEQMSAVQQYLEKNPDTMKQVEAHMQSVLEKAELPKREDLPSFEVNEDLMQMAQQMLSSMTPEQKAELEAAARQLFGQLGQADDGEDDEDEE